MLQNNSLYGNYRQIKFSDKYQTESSFIDDYNTICVGNMGLDNTLFTSNNAKTLFYLLYANYGNSIIASSDINRFTYKLWEIVFKSGPAWVKKLDLQNKILALDDEQIEMGSFTIYNSAANPSTRPNADTTTILTKIDNQNTTRHQRSPLEAYALVIDLIKEDVTSEFLNKFKKLFNQFAQPEVPLWYVSDV